MADENLNGGIFSGLLTRNPHLDIVRSQDMGLSGADDPEVLTYAASDARIDITHDGATMPDHAFERIDRGETMPGVFVISDRLSVGQAIDEILMTVECSEPGEWTDRVVRLPL